MIILKAHKQQKGFALVTALVFLVILTILGISLMGGVTLHQKMANNIQQKQRAFQASQLSLKTVINQLPAQNLTPVSCTQSSSLWRICNQNSLTSTSLTSNATWGIGTNNNSGLGTPITYFINSSSLEPNLNKVPEFIVIYAGQGKVPAGYSVASRHYGGSGQPYANIYEIVSMSTGGDSNSVAILQADDLLLNIP